MKHFIFITIILILLAASAYFLLRKEKPIGCGPKPGAPGQWICTKDGNWKQLIRPTEPIRAVTIGQTLVPTSPNSTPSFSYNTAGINAL